MNKKRKGEAASRKLIDRLVPNENAHGAIQGIFATTHDLNPDFVEMDFLPTLFGLGAWDDRAWSSRIALEKRLASVEATSILMAAGAYQGRPRSLRVEVEPQVYAGLARLHAKIVLVVYERAVRLVVGSANLTTQGYRSNREVAAVLEATPEEPGHAALIRQAIEGLPDRLEGRLTASARKVVELALAALSEAPTDAAGSDDEVFAWGGGERPLWQKFVDAWPEGEPLRRLAVVSPFWSKDSGDGPLTRLLAALSERGGAGGEVEVTLFAEAHAAPDGAVLPELPASLAGLDLEAWGARGRIHAVDPAVSKDEVDIEGYLGKRALHAKLVLAEGDSASVAYLGSGNFSRTGWGFVDPLKANIEAGIIVRRRGSARRELEALLPAATGEPVHMGQGAPAAVAEPPGETEPAPWPAFLRALRLEPSPAAADVLELVALVDSEAVSGPWSLEIPADEPIEILAADAGGPEEQRVRIATDWFRELAVHQELRVKWWACPGGREVPLNASLAARTALPLSPSADRPGEHMLLQYYQGKLDWSDLFPERDPKGQDTAEGGEVSDPSRVDTSRIQSYQVRAFVEALRGIENDLRAAVVSEPAMRLSLAGPVSPVALARQVVDAAENGERTPVAAGFQLVELLGCVWRAKKAEVPERHREAWERETARAAERIDELLAELKARHESEFADQAAFFSYEAMVRKSQGRAA